MCRSKNITVTGPLLKEKALKFARELKIDDFKASEGWLEKFKIRHNIKLKTKKGESNSVDTEVIKNWNNKLKSICDGYDLKNISNCDETGLFFKKQTDRTLAISNEEVKGGKKSKLRLTVLFCVSMEGEKLDPIVIGKSARPRCFKGINPG